MGDEATRARLSTLRMPSDDHLDRINPHRIAIYRAGALGDTLLLVPALRILRDALPHAQILLFVSTELGQLLVREGLGDACYSADQPGMAGLLSGEGEPGALYDVLKEPDLVVAYTKSTEQASKALRSLGPDFLVCDPMPPPGLHAGRHLVGCLTRLGIEGHWTSPQDIAPLRGPAQSKALSSHTTGSIVLHPGAGAEWKRAPAELFRSVAQTLSNTGQPVSVIGGPADSGALEEMGWQDKVIRDLPLAEAAAILASASGFVGNDSGLSHLAGLLGTPTVAIFGPTDPCNWKPLGPRVAVARGLLGCDEEAGHASDGRTGFEGLTSQMIVDCLRAVSHPTS